MFRLPTGRHLFAAIGERTDVALQQRIVKLQAELAEYRALVDRLARLITALKIGITALILALGVTLGVNTELVKQSVAYLVRTVGLVSPISNIDAGIEAYQKGKYAIALRLLQPLAEQSVSRAQYFLGLMYYHGYGLEQDDTQAVKWFRLAADQGDLQAQFNLGVIYAEGRGVPQDYAEALRWYRLAAEQGEPRAQFNLGVSYAEGFGVEEDYVAAYMWFNLAASRFSSSQADRRRTAISNRDLTANRMSREQIAEAQRRSREWNPK